MVSNRLLRVRPSREGRLKGGGEGKLTRWEGTTFRLLELDPLGCHCQTDLTVVEVQVVQVRWVLPIRLFAGRMVRQRMQGRGPWHLRKSWLAESRRSLSGREELAKEPLQWLRSW